MAVLETFHFDNAAELRVWLAQFKTRDLTTVLFDTPSGRLAFHWCEETLTDGSKVNNIRVGV